MVFAISWHLPYTLQLGSVRKVIVFFFSPPPGAAVPKKSRDHCS